MSKSQKILGWINGVFSALWLALVVVNGRQLQELSKGPEVTAFDFAPTAVVVFSALLNGYLAYVLLKNKKEKLSLTAYLLLTFSPIFWFALLFIGSFWVSHLVFPLLSIGLIVGVFYSVKKINPKLALAYSVFTALIVLITFVTTFEEDYCWGQGDKADPSGTKMVMATQQDAALLYAFSVTAGQDIGVSFREHMLCHQNFNWAKAAKESYLLSN